MTFTQPISPSEGMIWPSAGVVLVAPGGVSSPDGQLLAGLLGLRSLSDAAGRAADPNAALTALQTEPSGWLLPLSVDPAAELAQPGCWVDALAAWRQPVVLQLQVAQATAGPARAYAALLEAAQVPLVGLVQLGEPWQPQRRRADGLPWLGWLPAADRDPEAAAALRLALITRWRLSSARAAGHVHPAA